MGLQFFSGWRLGLMGLVAIALVSCGGGQEPPVEPEPSGTTEDSIPMVQGEPLKSDSPTPDQKVALEAGAYCYRTDEADLQAIAEFLVEPDNSVTGTLEATVTDAANNYNTSYDQTFAGVLQGDQLTASITTNIEDDVQQNTETWTLNDKQFSSDSAIFLQRVNCEEIIALKISQKSDPKPEPKPVAIAPTTTPAPAPAPTPTPTPQPAATPPTPTPTPAPTPAPQPAAAPSGPITVAFKSGETETVVKGSLTSGQTQVYNIAASEGQNMYLEMVNDSGKALFDVEVDNGEYIQGDLAEFIEFTLPFNGTYIVTVKAQEANTNYALTVRIQ